ncbi:MAG: hypothetical protein ACLFR0_02140 [Alphaproteobacteria bacterium]
MSVLYQWLDIIWIPIVLLIVTKEQRIWALGFLFSCMLMMRLQVEVMHETGYPQGFTNFMTSDAFDRGLVVYSVFYVAYLILTHYSPNTRGALFIAGSISIFFMAFFSSSLIMIL